MSVEPLADNPNIKLERILVIENPYSKNGARGRRQVQKLIDSSELHFDLIETDRDPEVTASHLDILEPTDLLCVIGGDGTVNSVIKPLLRVGALLLPTRSGNANDLAMSMNGTKKPKDVYSSYTNDEAHAISAHPFEVNVDGDIKYAMNYASFGYGALASHYLNKPWQSLKLKNTYDRLPRTAQNIVRFQRDGYMLLKAAADAGLFEYKLQEAEQSAEAADVTLVHSERMAKLGKFNVRHDDPFFLSSILAKAGVVAMTEQFMKMMRAKMVCTVNDRDIKFNINSLNGDTTYYQVDGEAFPLSKTSNIGVRLADKAVRILSTRL
jgi:hypothetical protein